MTSITVKYCKFLLLKWHSFHQGTKYFLASTVDVMIFYQSPVLMCQSFTKINAAAVMYEFVDYHFTFFIDISHFPCKLTAASPLENRACHQKVIDHKTAHSIYVSPYKWSRKGSQSLCCSLLALELGASLPCYFHFYPSR